MLYVEQGYLVDDKSALYQEMLMQLHKKLVAKSLNKSVGEDQLIKLVWCLMVVT